MGDLEKKIAGDLKDAMKAKDAVTLSVLRMVKAALGNLAIEKKQDAVSDDDAIHVLQKQAKQRKESIASFEKGGRAELAAKEKKELEILQKYLPEQLDAAQIAELAKQAIQESGAASKADTGKVMKALMSKVKGRADGKAVRQVVQGLLK